MVKKRSRTRNGVEATARFVENKPIRVICFIISAIMMFLLINGQYEAACSYLGSYTLTICTKTNVTLTGGK